MVIVDFGLAKAAMAREKLEDVCGTLHYYAPELVRGTPYTPVVDEWALGVAMCAPAAPPAAQRSAAPLHPRLLGLDAADRRACSARRIKRGLCVFVRVHARARACVCARVRVVVRTSAMDRIRFTTYPGLRKSKSTGETHTKTRRTL